MPYKDTVRTREKRSAENTNNEEVVWWAVQNAQEGWLPGGTPWTL
jgi:hypothetical protein